MSSQTGAAPAAERDPVTLDRRAIAEFGRDDSGAVPEFVVALIGQFLEEASAQVEEMRVAGQRADLAALKAIAHALRGSSNMLGAKRLAVLCEEIEGAAGQGSLSRPEALSDVDQEFVKVRYALRAELQGAGER
jgi:HPt (histidine-containing phosphotransfer) domain-containing protein